LGLTKFTKEDDRKEVEGLKMKVSMVSIRCKGNDNDIHAIGEQLLDEFPNEEVGLSLTDPETNIDHDDIRHLQEENQRHKVTRSSNILDTHKETRIKKQSKRNIRKEIREFSRHDIVLITPIENK
jgi:hypothetical protein